MSELTGKLIAGALYRHWSEVIGDWLPTVFPGMVTESAEWTEWGEVWAKSWKGPIERIRNRQRMRVQLVSHLYVRRGTNSGRAGEIVERIRNQTAQICLAVADPGDESRVVTGYVRLLEPEVRDLSRGERDQEKCGIEQWVMNWRGIAEEV